MSSNHTFFTKLALLLVVIGALALAGCGGDDNGGISADDMARIDNAEAAAAAAMAAEATAKADAAAAMAAQMEAEADAAAAMAAQMEAEADAAAAMAAQATAEMNATAAIAAQAVAESEAMTAKAALTEAQEDLDAAEMALMAANEAKTMAETAKAVAESEAKAAMAAQTAAEAAQATAEAAQKVAEDAKTAADAALTTAQAERDKYKMMYEEATDVDTVGTTVGAAARAVAARIMNSVSMGNEDSADEQMMPDMINRGGVSVKKLMRTDDGLDLMVNEGAVTRLTEADAADDMAPVLTGLQGVALAKTGGGVTQEALIYSDAAKSTRAFSNAYPYTVNMSGAANAIDSNQYYYVADLFAPPAADPTGTPAAVTYKIGGTNNPKVSLSHAVSSSNRMQSILAGGTIRGSFDGVDGQYMCVAACDLTWTPTADGPVVELMVVDAGTDADSHLLFKADDPSTLLSDPDYLTFGVWMLAQDGPAAAGYIRPIAMANATRFDQENAAGLNGSATYKGDAAGYYATRAAGSAEATSGRFTATATLMANFDVPDATLPMDVESGDVAALRPMRAPMALDKDRERLTANNADTAMYYRADATAPVSFAGSKIDNFMAEDGTAMAGWVVNLNGGMLRTPADVMVVPTGETADELLDRRRVAYNKALMNARNASTFEGGTSGTGYAMEWTGVWDATFHGNNTSTLPTGVVGTFQADAGSATPRNVDGAINLLTDPGFAGVVGSFGAKR